MLINTLGKNNSSQRKILSLAMLPYLSKSMTGCSVKFEYQMNIETTLVWISVNISCIPVLFEHLYALHEILTLFFCTSCKFSRLLFTYLARKTVWIFMWVSMAEDMAWASLPRRCGRDAQVYFSNQVRKKTTRNFGWKYWKADRVLPVGVGKPALRFWIRAGSVSLWNKVWIKTE